MKPLLFLLSCAVATAAPTWVNPGGELPKGMIRGLAIDTGSMRPAIDGNTIFYAEPYTGQPIANGDWVQVIRASDGKTVMHEVTAHNRRAVYTSGISNRYSDGWSPRGNVLAIVRYLERPTLRRK